MIGHHIDLATAEPQHLVQPIRSGILVWPNQQRAASGVWPQLVDYASHSLDARGVIGRREQVLLLVADLKARHPHSTRGRVCQERLHI